MSERLTQLAYCDSLTGLPNRAALYRALDEFFKADEDSARQLDVDRPVRPRRLQGSQRHDGPLQRRRVAQGGRRPLVGRHRQRTADLSAGRRRVHSPRSPIAGTPRGSRTSSSTMLQQLETPFDIAGTTAFVSASAGIAIAPADGADAEELIANVDMALYKAKAVGRGQYAFFLNALRADAQARRDLDTKLRQAHLQGEFELYFQPQLRLADGAIVGAEALLRWSQGRSLIAPGAFIEMLAASPISASVGNWILRTACEAAASWRRPDWPPIRVAVNLVRQPVLQSVARRRDRTGACRHRACAGTRSSSRSPKTSRSARTRRRSNRCAGCAISACASRSTTSAPATPR